MPCPCITWISYPWVIASGYLVSARLGALVAVAIGLHKVHEGVAIASLFLKAGRSTRAALAAALALGIATVLGTLLTLATAALQGVGLALAAGPLDAEGLAVRLGCRNLSGEPMPCGLGLHPYFPCTPTTRIDTKVSHVWTIDARVLPVDRIPATGRYDLADRPVCGQGLDNGFDGWSGEAAIASPALPFALLIRSPDAGRFQLYSPPSGGHFVAEPVTHANSALNRPEAEWSALGIRILDPGEEMALNARFDVEVSA